MTVLTIVMPIASLGNQSVNTVAVLVLLLLLGLSSILVGTFLPVTSRIHSVKHRIILQLVIDTLEFPTLGGLSNFRPSLTGAVVVVLAPMIMLLKVVHPIVVTACVVLITQRFVWFQESVEVIIISEFMIPTYMI